MDFYLILALGPRNGLGYCVVNRHKVKGEIIIIIITIIIIIIIIITTIIIMILNDDDDDNDNDIRGNVLSPSGGFQWLL